MNPLNRRMFRDPRAARRATGILASSAPLMTAAQKAMAQGQPMRAQRGASVNTSTAMPNPGAPFFQNRILSSLASMFNTGSDSNRSYGQPPNRPVSAAPGYVDPSLAKINEVRIARGLPPIVPTPSVLVDMARSTQPNLPRGVAGLVSDESAITKGLVEAGRMVAGPDYDDLGTAPTAVSTETVVSPPAGPGEQVAAGRGQDPTVTPTGGEPGGGKLSAEDEALIAAQGSGSSAATEAAKDLLKETKEAGGKVSAPTITPSTVTLPSGFEDTGVPSTSTGTETTTEQTNPEDALPDSLKGKRSPGKGVSATKEAAAQNDALLNISDTKPDGKPLTYKERVQARFEVLKDLIGEDQAKDIRTDKNYNLMMLGLRIAAGQDPNALSNIAAGAGQQLQEFGEVSGEERQRRAEKIESLTMLAASDVSEEMKAEAARDFAKSEREATQLFQAGEAEKGRDFQFDMNMFDKNFASLESSLNRQHDMATRILGEEYADRRAKNAADLQIAIRNANSQDQINLAVANYEFQADMAAQGRIFDLDKLILTQQFAKEQGVDDREFRAKLAMLPGDTQRLYEEYLTPDQIAKVLTTDKSKANRSKERGYFIEKFTTTESSMDLVRDALAKKGLAKG